MICKKIHTLPFYWEPEAISHEFHEVLASHDLGMGKLAQPVRVAVTGGTASPGIFEVLDVLGKERTLSRIRSGIERAKLSTTG